MPTSPFRVLSALHQASREVGLYVDDLLSDLGLSGQEAQLLAFAEARDGVPVTELVTLLGTPKSTMTSMLDRLQNRGLVKRRPKADDRRSLLVVVSTNGRSIAREAKQRVLGLDRRLSRRVGEDDIAALHRIRCAIGGATGIDLTTQVSAPLSPQR